MAASSYEILWDAYVNDQQWAQVILDRCKCIVLYSRENADRALKFIFDNQKTPIADECFYNIVHEYVMANNDYTRNALKQILDNIVKFAPDMLNECITHYGANSEVGCPVIPEFISARWAPELISEWLKTYPNVNTLMHVCDRVDSMPIHMRLAFCGQIGRVRDIYTLRAVLSTNQIPVRNIFSNAGNIALMPPDVAQELCTYSDEHLAAFHANREYIFVEYIKNHNIDEFRILVDSMTEVEYYIYSLMSTRYQRSQIQSPRFAIDWASASRDLLCEIRNYYAKYIGSIDVFLIECALARDEIANAARCLRPLGNNSYEIACVHIARCHNELPTKSVMQLSNMFNEIAPNHTMGSLSVEILKEIISRGERICISSDDCVDHDTYSYISDVADPVSTPSEVYKLAFELALEYNDIPRAALLRRYI